jgi:hypothetical protein
MPDRSKGQMKCSPRSSRMGFGRGAKNTTSDKPTVTKPPESMKEDDGGGQGCSASEE